MQGPVSFVCNVCDRANLVPRAELKREARTCGGCGSSVRIRAIVHLLSLGLFGRSLALRDFPYDRSLRGIGLGDWSGYARPLAERLDYTNTWFHAEPRLDITNVPDALAGSCDFVVSAEVFEHVAPPAQRAFDGARRLLKPGGVMVLTVPFNLGGTVEHFPDLHEFELAEEDGRRRLYNRRRDGSLAVHDDLVFHGGPGSTLEMRLFGLRDVLDHCVRAGFREAAVQDAEVPERGIAWLNPWSVPILTRT